MVLRHVGQGGFNIFYHGLNCLTCKKKQQQHAKVSEDDNLRNSGCMMF